MDLIYMQEIPANPVAAQPYCHVYVYQDTWLIWWKFLVPKNGTWDGISYGVMDDFGDLRRVSIEQRRYTLWAGACAIQNF